MLNKYYSLISLVGLTLVACQDDDTPFVEQPLLLHYDRPAQFFEESLPIGNGQLGALVYGGVADEHISLNDIMLWTGGPDLTPWTPDAHRFLPEVRALLEREDYPAAEKANMQIEGHNSEIYQPLGELRITNYVLRAEAITDDELQITDYRRWLDLNHAVAGVEYSLANGHRMERQSFASAPDSVLVFHLKSYGTALNQRITLSTQQKVQQLAVADNALWLEGYTAYSTKPEAGKDEWFHYDEQRGIHFRTELRVMAPQGCVANDGDSALVITGCDEATIVLTNVTSFNGPYNDPVAEGRDYRTAVAQRLEAACAKTYAQLQARHDEDYRRLFTRVRLDVGQTPDSIAALPTDQQLLMVSAPMYCERSVSDSVEAACSNPDLEELYFQYGRYLLISSSRTEGVPANLQGLWNERLTPPWSCNYTTNINVEENYWPAEVAALPEMHQSLLSWIERLPRSGAISAANYYGISGLTTPDADSTLNTPAPWCLCHNSDIWCMTNPVGYQHESPMWCCWPIGGAWVSTHLWEHYTFTGDRAYLERVWPVMKGAASFVEQWLVEKDGCLMTMPSTTPENEYKLADGFEGATFYGGAADVAMIRELLTDVCHAAQVLGQDCSREQQVLERLMPYKVGAAGNLHEWYHDWADKDPHHRHQSHLFGLYPGHHITVDDTPELAAACARTLEIKGDKTTGWSSGWRVNLHARLRNAKEAYHVYRKLMTFVHPDAYRGEDRRHGGGTYPNLFDAHSPFQIDGNFGGAAGVIEMLVQSRWVSETEAEAFVLPALPDQWRAQGSISGVRLRGGYELSMTWRDGKVEKLDVKRLAPGKGKLTVRSQDGQCWTF